MIHYSLTCIYMNFSLYSIHLFQCHFISYLLLCNKLSPKSSSLKQVYIIWPSFWKLGIQKQLQFSSVQFSRSVMSEIFWPRGLQHTRFPCPSPSPKVCSNPCPLNCDANYLILYHPLLLLPSVFPSIWLFSNESVLHIRWPKYCSFSFSISQSFQWIFRTDFL